MRQTYRVVAWLIALGVLVQAASVAFGWFQVISDIDSGLVLSGEEGGNVGHTVHGMVGMIVMPLLALVLLGISFAAAKVVPGARKWAGIVLGLTVLQVLLAFVAFGAPIIGALHGLNALLLFGAAGRAAMQTRTTAAATSSDTAAAGGIPAQRSSSGSSTGADLPA
jgi:hypothetical protein